jgi:hypothetical protein
MPIWQRAGGVVREKCCYQRTKIKLSSKKLTGCRLDVRVLQENSNRTPRQQVSVSLPAFTHTARPARA